MHDPTDQRDEARFRRYCLGCAAALIGMLALGAISPWILSEALRLSGSDVPPAIVEGSSMAETLHGPTLVGTCRDCAAPMRFARETVNPTLGNFVVCPNCGAENGVERLESRGADGFDLAIGEADQAAMIDRIVVVAPPDGSGEAPLVKRVVAGPGQRVALRGGDLFRDGKLVRRDPAAQDNPAIPVHDAACLPRSASDAEPSPWVTEPVEDDRVRYAFRPWSVWSPTQPRGRTPVLDAYPSQAVERRSLVYVPDVRVRGRISAARRSAVRFVYRSGERELTLFIDATGRWEATASDEAFPSAFGFLKRWSPDETFEFGLLDRQLFLAQPGRIPVMLELPGDAPMTPTDEPLAIEIPSDARLTELTVVRDVHYLSPSRTDEAWEEPIEGIEEGWFLLGDNPAASIDSRHFGRVSEERFLGRALLPPREAPRWASFRGGD